MVLFMTSSPDGHTWDDPMSAVSMDAANDFINNLKKFWKDGARGLFVACNPADYAENDKMSSILMNSLKLSGLEVLSMDICDDRNTDITKTYDFMILAGGHLPTQNEFFKRINMKETVNNYEGIVIGISAGTMNCAKIVYSLPEEEGETFDENFDRFPEGLGLTGIQVIPHYQYLFDKYSLNPAECIFFDDRLENVEASNKLGMRSVQITSKEVLLDQLNKLEKEIL